MKREYNNILEQNTKISFNEKFLHSVETSYKKEKNKQNIQVYVEDVSDSCSNWLRIKQYLDILFLCGDYGICVHLFGFKDQNCLLVRNFKPV